LRLISEPDLDRMNLKRQQSRMQLRANHQWYWIEVDDSTVRMYLLVNKIYVLAKRADR
jgi:hypothetical protein